MNLSASWLLVGAFAMVLVALIWLPKEEELSIRDQTEQAAPNAPNLRCHPEGLDQRTLDRSKPDESPPVQPRDRPSTISTSVPCT